MSPAEIDSLIASAARAGRVITRDEFYSHYEMVNRILTDRAGHVYVLTDQEGFPQGTAVDVFEESGIYLGRVRFPEPILVERPVPHITRDFIYAVPQHALDVPYVTRLKIVRP